MVVRSISNLDKYENIEITLRGILLISIYLGFNPCCTFLYVQVIFSAVYNTDFFTPFIMKFDPSLIEFIFCDSAALIVTQRKNRLKLIPIKGSVCRKELNWSYVSFLYTREKGKAWKGPFWRIYLLLMEKQWMTSSGPIDLDLENYKETTQLLS